jgi:hypothetical protein
VTQLTDRRENSEAVNNSRPVCPPGSGRVTAQSFPEIGVELLLKFFQSGVDDAVQSASCHLICVREVPNVFLEQLLHFDHRTLTMAVRRESGKHMQLIDTHFDFHFSISFDEAENPGSNQCVSDEDHEEQPVREPLFTGCSAEFHDFDEL